MTEMHTPADLADFEAYIADCLRHRAGDERASLERFLRSNPGHTVRDWIDGYPRQLCPREEDRFAPPSGRARTLYVRATATRNLAHTLAADIRRAAARDPGLIWNPLARRYRLRADATPAPALATPDAARPLSKVPDPASSRPAAASDANANPIFPAGNEPDHDT